MRGAISLTSCRYFPTISVPASSASPVTLPPGRARLATRPRRTGVDHARHDDGDRARGLLRRAYVQRGHGDDEVDLHVDELGRERPGTILLPLGIPALDGEIAARHVAVFPKALDHGLPVHATLRRALLRRALGVRWAARSERKPDPVHLRGLLPVGSRRTNDEAEGEHHAESGMQRLHRDLPFESRRSRYRAAHTINATPRLADAYCGRSTNAHSVRRASAPVPRAPAARPACRGRPLAYSSSARDVLAPGGDLVATTRGAVGR